MEHSELRKQFEKIEAESVNIIKSELLNMVEVINDIEVITQRINVSSMNLLKQLAAGVRDSGSSLVLAIGAEIDGKANLLVLVSKDLVEDRGINASEIIKVISKEINGGGGGQAFLATTGGKNRKPG